MSILVFFILWPLGDYIKAIQVWWLRMLRRHDIHLPPLKEFSFKTKWVGWNRIDHFLPFLAYLLSAGNSFSHSGLGGHGFCSWPAPFRLSPEPHEGCHGQISSDLTDLQGLQKVSRETGIIMSHNDWTLNWWHFFKKISRILHYSAGICA